jgi:hypothetical protein
MRQKAKIADMEAQVGAMYQQLKQAHNERELQPQEAQ